jgi:hypothetical protein
LTKLTGSFYGPSEHDDRVAHAGMLERKRDDIVRSIVLQLHTSIEDLLNSHVTFRMTGAPGHSRQSLRSESARALRKMLYGGGSIGFEMKLNLALGLRIITGKTKEKLVVLNTLRNKCSHNWLLKVPVRYGKRPAQKEPPLLLYEGRDLHGVANLKGFVHEYTSIYLKLLLKSL